jgi:hypothetical protein
MKFTTRQKAGIGLIALSVVAAAIIILTSPRPLLEEDPPLETSKTSIGPMNFTTSVQVTTLHVRYVIPLLLCAGAGLFCLLWTPRNSTRKRP